MQLQITEREPCWPWHDLYCHHILKQKICRVNFFVYTPQTVKIYNAGFHL